MSFVNRFFLAITCMAMAFCTGFTELRAQGPDKSHYAESARLPYRIQTAGNQITVKCSKDIKTVMAWTTGGTRILEKTILAPLFSFRVPTSHKMVFLRIELTDGKTYSEKIGVN